jgi:hypothetical protein
VVRDAVVVCSLQLFEKFYSFPFFPSVFKRVIIPSSICKIKTKENDGEVEIGRERERERGVIGSEVRGCIGFKFANLLEKRHP